MPTASPCSSVLPQTWIALRTPSGQHKVVKIIPDTTISLGKYGSFDTNALLGRPYYLTYELVEKSSGKSAPELRIVTAAELHADALIEEQQNSTESHDQRVDNRALDGGDEAVKEAVELLTRNNKLTVDDASRQALTAKEIEELKRTSTGSGKDIVATIMNAHTALDEKTAFSLAKYAVRKNRKYLKRFTALPMNVSMLARWMVEEKEAARVMEIREESLGLVASWSNVHYSGLSQGMQHLAPSGRWLVVDETGGLVVAALAERMGILWPEQPADEDDDSDHSAAATGLPAGNPPPASEATTKEAPVPNKARQQRRKPKKYPPDAMSATNNTITLIHPAAQPNISMLSYFSYDPSDTSSKSSTTSASEHPLHTHLKTVTLLQLISPSLDGSYAEPEAAPDSTIATWKSSQRGNYYRKRRRWQHTKRVVDEVRAGGFDGLVVASTMAPATLLHHIVPLLKGGAPVVVYSPNVEPLVELSDFYSSSRKKVFLGEVAEGVEIQSLVPTEDFPLDPRLLLAPTLQTARAEEWQVLPGRTHPVMTSRGGAEGYLFTAVRVLPVEGKVEARGRFAKKRKFEVETKDVGEKV